MLRCRRFKVPHCITLQTYVLDKYIKPDRPAPIDRSERRLLDFARKVQPILFVV
jgi:hypothetical protein